MAYFLGKGIDANLDDLFPREGNKAQCLERCKEQLALDPGFDYQGCIEGCSGMRVQPGETFTQEPSIAPEVTTSPVSPTPFRPMVDKIVSDLYSFEPRLPLKPRRPPIIPPDEELLPIIPPLPLPEPEPLPPPIPPPEPEPEPEPEPDGEEPDIEIDPIEVGGNGGEEPVPDPEKEKPIGEETTPTGYIDKLIAAMFGRGFETVRGIGGRTRESVYDMLAREGLLGTGAARGVAEDVAWQTERGIADLMRGVEEMKYMQEQDALNMLLTYLFSQMGAWR